MICRMTYLHNISFTVESGSNRIYLMFHYDSSYSYLKSDLYPTL